MYCLISCNLQLRDFSAARAASVARSSRGGIRASARHPRLEIRRIELDEHVASVHRLVIVHADPQDLSRNARGHVHDPSLDLSVVGRLPAHVQETPTSGRERRRNRQGRKEQRRPSERRRSTPCPRAGGANLRS
jgi:hypothetical protein